MRWSARNVFFAASAAGLALLLTPEAVRAQSNGYDFRKIALEGDPAPVAGEETYESGFLLPAINSAGDVAFGAVITGSGPLNSGIFVASGDTDAALVLPGDTAPDTGTTPELDGTYTGNAADFNMHALDASGGVAFRSDVTAGLVASGIFVDFGATQAAFALAGDPAPGFPAGTYSGSYSVFGTPSQNDAGSVAFTADVTGGAAASGVFLESGTTGAAVAVEGGTAPETGGGTYAAVTSFGALDDSGRVAFSATLTGGSVGAGVFLFDPASGQTSAVTLAGQTAPDAGGATFSEFGFVALNGASQVAMEATISDGSAGIFLASPIAAPVPALRRSTRVGPAGFRYFRIRPRDPPGVSSTATPRACSSWRKASARA